MDDKRVVRLTALAGLLFVVLIIVQGPVLTPSLKLTDSAHKIFNSIQSHQSNIKASAGLYGLAMSAVLIWAAGLFRVLRKAEGGAAGLAAAAVGGISLAAAATVVAAATEAATALRIKDLGPGGARFYFTLSQFTQGGILFGLLVVVGAAGLVSLRTGLIGRWFGIVSVVLAVVSVVGAAGVAYASDGIQIVTAIALSLDTLWVLVISFYLWREPELAIP
jgi:uncharacterized protein DUF4386